MRVFLSSMLLLCNTHAHTKNTNIIQVTNNFFSFVRSSLSYIHYILAKYIMTLYLKMYFTFSGYISGSEQTQQTPTKTPLAEWQRDQTK